MKKYLQNTIPVIVAILMVVGCNQQNTPTESAPFSQETARDSTAVVKGSTNQNIDSSIAIAKLAVESKALLIGNKYVNATATDTIASDNVMLLIDSGAVSRDVQISILATTEEHSGEIPSNMENLTAGGAVYRMLPDGQKFEKDITIAMRYDSTALPYGFTPDDIYTFFYNEQAHMWQQVARDSVDTKNQIVYSRTNHFTDYINGVLKVPENSDAMAYTPTTIKDLKAADPMEGITLIAPPEANNMGTANLTYPLNIPAGRRGMQPNLAITYNSSGGNGILGLGWSLPISEISVETRWGVPLYDSDYETEGYLFDGTTLVTADEGYFSDIRLKKPVYHRNYELRDNNHKIQRFYPRVEGSFRKIERIGSSPNDYHWVVTEKDGTRHFYGLTNQATLRDHKGNIAKWMLEKSVDTYGNTVNYTYTTKTVSRGAQQPLGKQLCIRKIQYTGFDKTNDPGQYIIRFGYTDKPDSVNSFRYGLEEINQLLLDSIDVMFRDTIVRKYYFGYMEGAFGKSLLCKIFEGYDDGARDQTYKCENLTNTIRNFSPFARCGIAPNDNSDSTFLQIFHAFEYYDAGKYLFANGVPINHFGNENSIVFSKHDSTKQEQHCFSGSGSFGWNIGGGVNVGGDCIPWLKTFSVGGHFSYGEDYAEGFMQLVDINGDGYPDKLYKTIYDRIMCRPQIPGQNLFGEPIEITGIKNFQYTSSNTQNWGWEASAITAGVGETWCDGRSNTSVYVSDVNGDGLIDIVDNGGIYVNRGNYVFSNVTNNDTIQIPGLCKDDAIDFSGEVNPNIFDNGYYTVERVVCQIINEEVHVQDTVYNENGSFTIIGDNTMLLQRDSCWTVIDTLYYSYPQRYEPDIDLVRMWKAPYDGNIVISGSAKLTDALGTFRLETRTNDGVWVAIQRAGELSPRKDTIVLPGQTKNMSCEITVNKGDTIFFRINARDKRLYDQVNWIPHIGYTFATHSNSVAFSSTKIDANRDSVYRFDYKNDFMLAANQSVAIGPAESGVTCTNNYSIICTIKATHPLSQDMVFSAVAVNIDNSGTESLINYTTFSHGSSPDVTLTWTALNIPSSKKLILRLSPMNDGQLNWADIRTDATVSLIYSSDVTINSRLSDNDAREAYVYHPIVERFFYDYLVFPSEPVSMQSGAPPIKISTDDSLFKETLFMTIKDYNNNVCWAGPINFVGGSATLGSGLVAFMPHVAYSFDFYTTMNSIAKHLNSIRVSLDGGATYYNAGLYAKYGPDNGKHHGTLYRGWGQFGYKSPATSFPYIRSDLIHADSYYANGIDTNTLKSQIANLDVSTLDADGNPETNPGGLLLNPLSGTFFEMHADGKKGRWASFSNLVTVDSILSSLDNTDPAIENGQNATVNMFQSPLPVITQGSKMKAVNKMSMNKSNGYTKIMQSHSEGYSRLLGDFMDLNGDRYPDNVSEKSIQYSRAQGGLGNSVHGYSPCGINRTENISEGTAYNGSFLNTMYENVPNAKRSRSMTTVAGLLQLVNGSSSQGTDETQNTFIDINGDGLADIVLSNDSVKYNMGYMFSSPRHRPNSQIRSSHSETGGQGVGFNSVNTSITGGISRNTSENKTTFGLMDINGDGLPDKVTPFRIYFNKGNAYPNQHYQNNVGTDNSLSTTFSLNISATLDYVILPFLKVGGSAGGGASFSLCYPRAEFTDMDNDGYADYVYLDGNQIMVCYSKIGRANLLKSVTNFSGAKFQIDYEQKESSVQCPQRYWNMVSLIVDDGHDGDGESKIYKRFDYDNRHYDRYERDDYGYSTVLTYDYATQADFNSPSSHAVYRTTTQNYHNDNYFLAHLKKYECVSQGNKYVENIFSYTVASIIDGDYIGIGERPWCDGYGWPALEMEKSRYCEGTNNIISTKREYQYGPYGNVTRVIDYGDSVDASDNYIVNISYSINPSQYIVANVSGIGIPNYRNRQATYNNKGSLTSLTVHNNSSQSSVYQFYYDQYGNDSVVTTPAIQQGTNIHYWIKYSYDPLTHSLPIRVVNAEGHLSMAEYSLRWQKPINTIDIGGNRIHYAYDNHGRIDTIIAPKELFNNKPYTVKYDYWYNQKYPISNPNQYYSNSLIIKYSWARTRNFDPANTDDINTVTFSDGLGRVIQVKKDIDEQGVEKRVVGGTVHYDGLGRKVKEYFPICEPNSQNDSILNASVTNNVYYTETHYDYLNRPTRVDFADETYTTNSYSIAPDAGNIYRFCNAISDQNRHTSYVYTDPRQLRVQFVDALNHITKFSYDAVGQLISSEDPEHNTTTHTYDQGGRRTGRSHPASGHTQWDYNPAGNIVKQTQNSGEYIEYFYDYSRIVHIAYSNRSWNNVWYEYGAANTGNQAGRLVRQQDATGVQSFEYDNMGNVVTNTHTYVQPHSNNTFTLTTHWSYDSWGRVNTIIYPDGEEVTYSYDHGGNVKHIEGLKYGQPLTTYIDTILYDRYGQRVYQRFGNDMITYYQYDSLTRHLRHLVDSSIALAYPLQRNTYRYDNVGNIIGINDDGYNNREQFYEYDSINRLIYSEGDWREGTLNYKSNYTYSDAGQLLKKDIYSQRMSTTLGNYLVNYDNEYSYLSSGNSFAISSVQDNVSGNINSIAWDANGNIVQSSCNNSVYHQYLCWTEDNRLQGYTEGSNEVGDILAWYNYSANGKRNFKITSPTLYVRQNASGHRNVISLIYPTLYASELITISRNGYTKHYFEGTNRICSQIGGGFRYTSWADLTQRVPCISGNYENQIYNQSTSVISTSANCLNVSVEMTDLIDLQDVIKHEFDQNLTETPYFYHLDHLGSAAYITDKHGQVVQTLNYLPYGEDWVEIHNTTSFDTTRLGFYRFNGKEKDYESGFHYYGARYYWSELLTSWLSVDPMADKYPNISPYAYCAWNPVKLVDPDGEEIDEYKLNTANGSLILTRKTSDNFDIISTDNGQNTLKVSKGILNGKDVGDDISKTGFNAPNGKQAEGVEIMRFISFASCIELGGWGYDNFKGEPCLDVDDWNKNTSTSSWGTYKVGDYYKRGTRKFRVHVHPGTKEGRGGTGKPSKKDIKNASKIPTNYYIISRRDGLTQYDSKGNWYMAPNDERTPKSLQKYIRK